jgi:hypothetical protein
MLGAFTNDCTTIRHETTTTFSRNTLYLTTTLHDYDGWVTRHSFHPILTSNPLTYGGFLTLPRRPTFGSRLSSKGPVTLVTARHRHCQRQPTNVQRVTDRCTPSVIAEKETEGLCTKLGQPFLIPSGARGAGLFSFFAPISFYTPFTSLFLAGDQLFPPIHPFPHRRPHPPIPFPSHPH